MHMEKVPVGELTFDPSNVRKHSGRNIDAIKASLTRFGQQKPIVIDADGVVVAGNGTLAAAIGMGWTDIEVVRSSLKGAEATAYAIADNRTAELAEWDVPDLTETLAALQNDSDIDHLVTGFSDDEIAELVDGLMPDTDPVEDEAPEVMEGDAITQAGDLWVMGGHRLLCGDSTDRECVDAVMGGEMAAAVLTDPPYGVGYVGKTKDALVVHNDDADGLAELLRKSLGHAFDVCREGGAWYVATPPGPLHLEFGVLLSGMGVLRQTLIWVKDSMVLGRSDYHYRHEPIYYGWKPGAKHKEPPTRKETSVWEVPRPKVSREHPTMKPVALYAKMMENSTAVGSVVYEPFGGSGTTLIACEQLGRECRAIELAPEYCDVICRRYLALTGTSPVRESDGAVFAELLESRDE